MTAKETIDIYWPILEELTDEEKSLLIERLSGSMKTSPAAKKKPGRKKSSDENSKVCECRVLKDFHGIHAHASCNVSVGIGPEFKVEICGRKKDVSKIKTSVHDDVLFIDMDPIAVHGGDRIVCSGLGTITVNGMTIVDGVSVCDVKPVTVKVTMPELWGCSTYASGNIELETDLVSDHDFVFELNGSGSFIAKEISCAGFGVAVKGSGNVRVDSLKSTAGLFAVISGAGSINMRNVSVSGDAELKISGSGNIIVNGHAEEVNALITGAGSIGGNLESQRIRTRVTGSGNINL